MSEVVRFGVSLSAELLAKFDSLIQKNGYPCRSEAIRDLVRREWTVVMDIQHNHHREVIIF